MSIEAIGALGAASSLSASGALSSASLSEASPLAEAARGEALSGAPRADFMDALGAGLSRADGSLRHADAQLRALSAGQDVPIHDVMIAMEQARLDLTLVVEVRNRLVESYQEMMRMQL